MGNFYDSLISDREKMLPYFCMLSHVANIGRQTYEKLDTHFASPKELFETGEEKIRSLNILTKGQLATLLKVRDNISPYDYFKDLMNKKIGFVSSEEENYPSRLREIPDNPIGLFYLGKLPDEHKPCAGVIGARECSFYGEEAARIIGDAFGRRGIQVISGMARGIDSLSQNAAIEAGGESYAVLGGGVDICYPRESKKLYECLKERGGIISEYPPGDFPQKTHFIRRNRIISGLSDVLCVVEAKRKSGTLITVDCALEQGRDVYAVPGRITDRTSMGCNELIRQGAEILNDPENLAEDITAKWGVSFARSDKTGKSDKNTYNAELSHIERLVLMYATEDSFVPEELMDREKMRQYTDACELITACTMLSYEGFLINMGGGRFRISKAGLVLKNTVNTGV